MKHTGRIQKYLNGEMNEAELKKFREDLQQDSGMAKQLDLHLSHGKTFITMDEEAFRKKLNDAYQVYSGDDGITGHKSSHHMKKAKLGFVLITTPVMLALLVVIYYQWFRWESNESIFNNFFVSYNSDSASRGITKGTGNTNLTDKGISLYNNKLYPEACRYFVKTLSESPGNTEAHFYNGLCYIYLNDFDNAIRSFDSVTQQPFSFYHEYARWYLALCYIRTNNNFKAKILLAAIVEEKGFFSENAKKVLGRIR
jgi:tetratricopeptide (TPR) repeat protein